MATGPHSNAQLGFDDATGHTAAYQETDAAKHAAFRHVGPGSKHAPDPGRQRLVETHADMLPEELSDPERSNLNRHQRQHQETGSVGVTPQSRFRSGPVVQGQALFPGVRGLRGAGRHVAFFGRSSVTATDCFEAPTGI